MATKSGSKTRSGVAAKRAPAQKNDAKPIREVREVTLSMEEVASLTPTSTPLISPSSFELEVAAEDFLLTCMRRRPMTLPSGVKITGKEDLAVLALSPQAAKDLMLVLAVAVKDFEEKHGAVRTTFSDRLQSEHQANGH